MPALVLHDLMELPLPLLSLTVALLRWSLDIHLAKEELKVIQPYINAVSRWASIMNDFMSWKRESAQATGRIVNIVHVLMQRHNLSEDVAMDLARGMLVKQESEVLERKKGLQESMDLSPGLRAYVDGLDGYMGGIFYWSLLSPRYATPRPLDN